MAYEWMFHRVMDDTDAAGNPLYRFTEHQKRLSEELKALYPAYLDSLNLRSVFDGTPVTGDNFEDYLKTFVLRAAQKALDKGADLSGKPWLTVAGGRVTDLDFDAWISYVGRITPYKDPPAFDWLGDGAKEPPRSGGSWENLLFGTAEQAAAVFTDFAASKLGVEVPPETKHRVFLMNPFNFIGREGSVNAPYWYIRHGTRDRHNAFAVPVSLYTKLVNAGTVREADFGLAWERGHGGDYDLEELFGWIDRIARQA